MSVRGYLAAARRGRLIGWAWDPEVPGRLEVGAFLDGEQVGAERAQIFRESLRRAGVGDGAHGFSIALPERLCDGGRHRVAAVVLASGTRLPATPGFGGRTPAGDPWHWTELLPDTELAPAATVVADAVAAGPRGALEAVIDGAACGWAYDPRTPRRRLAVEVVVDGEVVAETLADLPRPSLLAEGIGDGRHSFVVALPLRLRDGATHAIAARTVAGEPLPTASAFATRATARGWAGTTFAANGHTPPRPSDGAAQAATPAPAATPNGVWRLRPRETVHLPRRELGSGFSARTGPEAVLLAPEMDVEVAEPLQLVVQPGVADPREEWRKRVEYERRYHVGPLHAVRLPGAIVDTGSFLVVPDEHSYAIDSVRHRHTLLHWGYEMGEGCVEREFGAIPERPERVVSLGAQTNNNYSHWLFESVVKALLYAPLDDGSVHYLAPPLKEWQREALELAGVARERVLELEPQGPIRFAEVISVGRGMGPMPALRPAGVVALAGLSSPRGGRRRIHCSRRLMRRRHVSNEAELETLLARHGFESVCPETLTIREQIELFAQAEAVCSMHGSVLTNMLFSRPGTFVIELQAENFGMGGVPWNWILASLRDQPFVQVVCPQTDTLHHLPQAVRDITADLDHLDALLYRVLPV
jgi:capsular polysaccharide biosynthesis protein